MRAVRLVCWAGDFSMCSRIPSRRPASSRRPHRGRPQRRPPLPPGKADWSPGQDIPSRWLARPGPGQEEVRDAISRRRRDVHRSGRVWSEQALRALSPTRVRCWSPPTRCVRRRCGRPCTPKPVPAATGQCAPRRSTRRRRGSGSAPPGRDRRPSCCCGSRRRRGSVNLRHLEVAGQGAGVRLGGALVLVVGSCLRCRSSVSG